jgi:hypothetical protein
MKRKQVKAKTGKAKAVSSESESESEPDPEPESDIQLIRTEMLRLTALVKAMAMTMATLFSGARGARGDVAGTNNTSSKWPLSHKKNEVLLQSLEKWDMQSHEDKMGGGGEEARTIFIIAPRLSSLLNAKCLLF